MSTKTVCVLFAILPFLFVVTALSEDLYNEQLTDEDTSLLKKVVPSNVQNQLETRSYNYPKNKRFCHYGDIVIQPAKNCLEIKQKGYDRGNGVYWIDPNGGRHSDAFQVYCDMTSNGGGWTMCYTSNNMVRPATETAYNAARPYGKNGYRSNCNHIKFKEIMFVDEARKQTAYFSRDSKAVMTPAGNYGDRSRVFGTFTAHGTADANYKYQLLMCDTSFFRGFFVSGYTQCYKKCNHWCGDTVSPYFRTASSSASYSGVAFNVRGHTPVKPAGRLISVGLR